MNLAQADAPVRGTSVHDAHKRLIEPLRSALRSGNARTIETALTEAFAPDATIRLGYPLGEITGGAALWREVYALLLTALPDLERADFIVMAGPRWGPGQSGDWVGLGGNVLGTFSKPWLGIPPTGKPVFMRYHEYMRIEDGRIVEMEALWDIPQLMAQAGVWPMAPQLGREWMCPGPSTGLGVITEPFDPARADASVQLVWDMLHDLKQGDAATPDRGLGGYWHPAAPWYGPTGIGSARGHASIRDVVLRGFRSGLSENTRHLDKGVFFGDRDLVAFTGWPSATATHSGDGFLGLAPTGKRFTRRSLDFWRVEEGQVRENWVMVDMLDLYRQLGVDIFARMQALATA
ncbi:MAG: ester cyclase [Pseudomonadota bacterium]